MTIQECASTIGWRSQDGMTTEGKRARYCEIEIRFALPTARLCGKCDFGHSTPCRITPLWTKKPVIYFQ